MRSLCFSVSGSLDSYSLSYELLANSGELINGSIWHSTDWHLCGIFSSMLDAPYVVPHDVSAGLRQAKNGCAESHFF